MNRKTTFALFLVTLGLIAYIGLYERFSLSSGEYAERSQRLIQRLVRDRVTEVDIERGDERIEMRRTDAVSEDDVHTWALTAPVRTPAEEASVASMLGTIEWAQPVRTLEGITAEDRERFGLERPRIRVRFRVANEEITLLLGESDPTGSGVYARLSDASVAYVVGRDVFEAFDHDVSHFREKRLFADGLDEIAELTVHGPNGEARLRKDARGYQLVAPTAMRALSMRVEAAERALREIVAARFVTDTPVDGATYGFDAPFATITVESEAGRERRLLIGGPCEGHEGERHARVGDGPVVCAAQSALDPVLLAPSELRDLRPITSPDHQVSGLTLERGESRLTVREEDGNMHYTLRHEGQETQGDAHPDAVADWLRALRQARATEVVPLGRGREAALGLDRPQATLRVQVRVGEGEEEVLQVGAVTATGLYVRRDGEPVALRLPATAESLFEVAAHRLRDALLVDEEPERLMAFSIARGGVTARLALSEGAWQLTAPVAMRADPSLAADLGRRLARLEADRFVADAPAPEHGLAAPRLTVTARFEGAGEGDEHDHGHDHGSQGAAQDPEPRDILLTVGADAPGGAYARLGDDPTVFVLPAVVVELLTAPLADRRALSTSRVHIESVQVDNGRASTSIRKDGDGFATDRGAADPERTRGLLDRLSSLRATDAVSYGPPGADTGLASPRGRVTVTRSSEAAEPRRYTLLIGGATGTGDDAQVYVQRQDLAVVYRVPAAVVESLLSYQP